MCTQKKERKCLTWSGHKTLSSDILYFAMKFLFLDTRELQ